MLNRIVMLSVLLLAGGCATRTIGDAPLTGPGDGIVFLSCAVSTGGRLSDCEVQSEDPRGIGLGEAAIRLAEGARIHATPVRRVGRVTFPVRLRRDPASGATAMGAA